MAKVDSLGKCSLGEITAMLDSQVLINSSAPAKKGIRPNRKALQMLLLNLLLAAGPLLNLFSAQTAAAQFLQTDVFTYQLPHPKHELAAITTPEGLFIVYLPQRKGSLSGFDLRDISDKDALSLFLEYRKSSQVPDRLVLSSTNDQIRSHPIRGNFTVELDTNIRLSVAMNNSSVPYVTLINDEAEQEAILGFVGSQVVVNLPGRRAIELLEGDVLQREYGDVAGRYKLHPTKGLSLLDKPLLPGRSIGLGTPPNNPCLTEGLPLLRETSYQAYMSLTNAPTLKAYLSKQKTKPSLSSFLVLTVSAKGITAVDYDDGGLALIRNAGQNENSACVVSKLRLEAVQTGSTAREVATRDPAANDPAKSSPPTNLRPGLANKPNDSLKRSTPREQPIVRGDRPEFRDLSDSTE